MMFRIPTAHFFRNIQLIGHGCQLSTIVNSYFKCYRNKIIFVYNMFTVTYNFICFTSNYIFLLNYYMDQ